MRKVLVIVLVLVGAAPGAVAKGAKVTGRVLSVGPAYAPKALTRAGYSVRIELADRRVLDLRCLPSGDDSLLGGRRRPCRAPERDAMIEVTLFDGRDEVLLSWPNKGAKHGEQSETYRVLSVTQEQ